MEEVFDVGGGVTVNTTMGTAGIRVESKFGRASTKF